MTFLKKAKHFLRLFLLLLMAETAVPATVNAGVSASLSWTADPDPYVTGYSIYYGGQSHAYTNFISVGQVTNVVIPGLAANTVYFFAAKAHDSVGDESDFSSEIAFVGCIATPDVPLQQAALPSVVTNNLLYSLDYLAPPGSSIETSNGVFHWNPGKGYAGTTNYINVMATNSVTPATSIYETMQIFVLNYLNYEIGSVTMLSGQSNSIPLTVATSANLTNLQLVLDWPESVLKNPSITYSAPIISGTFQNQNGQLIIYLHADSNQPLVGTNNIANINFQTLASPTTALAGISGVATLSQSTDGNTFTNLPMQPGQVAAVGASPLLQPLNDTAQGRYMKVFANTGDFQLQGTSSLTPPVVWTPLSTFQQSNLEQVVRLDLLAPAMFYRIQQL